MLKDYSQKKGFVLVELLVVIAIINLLAVFILIVAGPARERARDAKAESDLRQIRSAFEIKYHDQGEYPDLPYDISAIPLEDERLAPYLKFVPNASGGKSYQWYNEGDRQKFCVLFKYEARPGYFACSHKGCQKNDSAACPNF